MKKLVVFIIAILLTVSVRADERSDAILKKMSTSIASYKTYRIEFTVSMEGEFSDIPGLLIVSGSKYYLDVYDSEVFFDGKDRYVYSEDNEEVIIEKPGNNEGDIFSRPDRLFDFYDRDFNHIYKGNSNESGKATSVIELTPRGRNTGFDSITVYADGNSMPVRVTYVLSNIGRKMDLRVTRIVPNVTVDDKTFVFDRSKYPGVEIIDFR